MIPVAALTLALTACSTPSPGNELDDDRPLVLATFTVLADMARNVAADRDAVTHALERTGLSNLADRQIGALSGGQRKRTFVARALAQNADVLPLDEPFAGVDKHSEATVIGVVFTALFALGLVLTSRVPSQTGLGHILFGNVLGVSDGDIAQILVLAVLVLAVVWYKHRDLTLYAFDPVHAHAIGLSPRLLETLLLGLLAVTVVIALQAVGIILVVAMVINPGATAYLLTDRFEQTLRIAAAVALCVRVKWDTKG